MKNDISKELKREKEKARLLKKILAYQKLVIEMQQYIQFLNQANESPIKIASIHGWECPKEDIDKGNEFRQSIELLKQKL